MNMKKKQKTIQELAAESISNATGIKAEKILLWANTHNIDIVNKGYILVKQCNWNNLWIDVSVNKFDKLKGII